MVETDKFCRYLDKLTKSKLPRAPPDQDIVFEYNNHQLFSSNISLAAQYLDRVYICHLGQQLSVCNGGLEMFDNCYNRSEAVQLYDFGVQNGWDDPWNPPLCNRFPANGSLRTHDSASVPKHPLRPMVDFGMKVYYSDMWDNIDEIQVGELRNQSFRLPSSLLTEQEDEDAESSDEEEEDDEEDEEGGAANGGVEVERHQSLRLSEVRRNLEAELSDPDDKSYNTDDMSISSDERIEEDYDNSRKTILLRKCGNPPHGSKVWLYEIQGMFCAAFLRRFFFVIFD